MSSTGNDILRRRSQAVAEAVASRFAPTTYTQVDRVGRTDVRLTMPDHLVEFELDWMDDLVEVFVRPLGPGRHARQRLVGLLPPYERALFESEAMAG